MFFKIIFHIIQEISKETLYQIIQKKRSSSRTKLTELAIKSSFSFLFEMIEDAQFLTNLDDVIRIHQMDDSIKE
jgi:hypothetical protein